MFSVSPAVTTAVSGGLTHLGRRPLVLLTVACLLGILWADWAVPPLAVLGLLCLLVITLAAFCLYRDLPATNVFLLLGIFLLGALLHTWRITPGPGDLPPPDARNLSPVEATVVQVTPRPGWGQLALLADLSSGGRLLVRQAQVSLPPTPPVQIADRLTLGGVSLWRPTSAGTPGEPDRARDLARDGLHAVGRAVQITQVNQTPSAARAREAGVVRLRARMLEALTQAMPGPDPHTYAQLLASMVYGMKAAPIPRPISDLFRSSGTIHLLVVSGAQVSIIVTALIFLMRGTRRVLPWWGAVLIVFTLLGAGLIAGMGVSINRAVAMAVLLLGSFASGRRYDFPTALALSALTLSLLCTATVFSVGAQLSYACSIGVWLAVPRQALVPERGRNLRRMARLLGWGSFGAWLFSTPVIVGHFHQLVLAAALANLVAVPLAVVLLYLGLGAIALGLIWPPLAVPLCGVARVLLELTLHSNQFFSHLPLAGLSHFTLPWYLLAAWYGAAVLFFWLLGSKTPWALVRELHWRRVLAGAAGVLCVGAIVVSVAGRPSHVLRLAVLDVGAGQCVLARAPGGANVLLDAGAEARGEQATRPAHRTVLPFLALQGVRSLEAIVLSHPHEDHCNLAVEIMRALPTRQLIVGPEAGAEASWPAILQVAKERGVAVLTAQAGGTLRLGPECALEFLEPTTMLGGTADDANNNSLVERLVYRQVRVLLPADLQAEGEGRLVEDYCHDPEKLRAEVLVASHHASVYSGTPDFLRAVAPEVVLVSCGSGARRPRPEALRVFEDLDLPIWRTDLSGTLQLTTDGRKVKVGGYRK